MTNAKVSTSNPNCISIQNFKAFGEMVNVPIRPITLIFGENSAGKSSILHSILFLNQLQYQSQDTLADVTYTKAGGNSVDLGGLSKLMFGHNKANELSFTIHKHSYHNIQSNTSDNLSSFHFYFSGNGKSNTIALNFNKLTICKLSNYTQTNSPVQIEFDIMLDNYIECLQHPAFKSLALIGIGQFMKKQPIRNKNVNTQKTIRYTNFSESLFLENQIEYLSPLKGFSTIIRNSLSLPNYDEVVNSIDLITDSMHRVRNLDRNNYRIFSSNNHSLEHIEFGKTDENNNTTYDLLDSIWWYFIFMYIDFAWMFNNISYLGPIRTIPTRNFDTLDSIARDPSTGSSAWERLASDVDTRTTVNKWLNKLGTNKEIRTERLIESAQIRKLLSNKVTVNQILKDIDSGQLSSRHMLRFYDTQKDLFLSHRDMGVGISQVLPVIVNCVANTNTTVHIEQPELHLHPRLQGDVADLLIDTAIKGEQKNSYLIETHSEHIIRRIMRRIREDQHKPAGDKRITKDDVAILYVANGTHGSTVTQLRLDDEGDLIDEWPNGFFEEGFRDDMAGR